MRPIERHTPVSMTRSPQRGQHVGSGASCGHRCAVARADGPWATGVARLAPRAIRISLQRFRKRAPPVDSPPGGSHRVAASDGRPAGTVARSLGAGFPARAPHAPRVREARQGPATGGRRLAGFATPARASYCQNRGCGTRGVSQLQYRSNN